MKDLPKNYELVSPDSDEVIGKDWMVRAKDTGNGAGSWIPVTNIAGWKHSECSLILEFAKPKAVTP